VAFVAMTSKKLLYPDRVFTYLQEYGLPGFDVNARLCCGKP